MSSPSFLTYYNHVDVTLACDDYHQIQAHKIRCVHPGIVSTAYGLYFCKYLPLNVALTVLRDLATRVARQHQLLAALLRPELNGTSTAAET